MTHLIYLWSRNIVLLLSIVISRLSFTSRSYLSCLVSSSSWNAAEAVFTEISMIITVYSVREKLRSCATVTAVGPHPHQPFPSVGSAPARHIAVETTIAPCLPQLLRNPAAQRWAKAQNNFWTKHSRSYGAGTHQAGTHKYAGTQVPFLALQKPHIFLKSLLEGSTCIFRQLRTYETSVLSSKIHH